VILLAASLWLLWAAAGLAEEPPRYGAIGPYPVADLRLDLIDAVRNRIIPIKIYYPLSPGSFPVIVFSHGLGGTREGYEYLGRHWAGHGFIAIHPQHIGSDDAVWQGSKRPLQDLKATLQKPENAVNRPLDVRFVLDRLEEINRNPGPLSGRIDPGHVGAAGHSFGAFTTLVLAGASYGRAGDEAMKGPDPRIQAALPISPPAGIGKLLGTRAYQNIRIPLLVITGTKDTSPVDPGAKAEDRRLPYDGHPGPNAYLIVFDGADHMVFSGTRLTRGPQVADAAIQQNTLAASTAFFGAFLKGDSSAKAFLDQDGLKRILAGQDLLERK
jgi:predicted dienelactone hydrolase